jgi:DNA polymerase-3 subunit delta'
MSQAEITEPLPDVDGDHPPRFTRALVGHERPQRDFLDALQGHRLPHAWLLSGPEGIGKASFAYMVARALLSNPNPQTIESLSPVTDTPETQLIENSVHPDLYVLNRRYNLKTEKFRGDIRVEDTREMKKSFELSASRGGWRIAIIDSIDEMNKSGVNALLKLIEEPPEKCLFLIVCHNPGRVLDTIRSRCRSLSFGALDEGQLQQIIAGRLEGIDENEAAAAAFLADGSAGRALLLAEMGGFDLYRDMVGVLEGLPQLDVEALHGLAGRFGARSEPASFRLFCYLFSGWLHRVVRAASTGQAFQPVFQGEAELVARLVSHDLPLEPALSLWEKVQHQVRQVEGLNLDKKQAILEWFAMLADILRAKSA